MSDPILEEIKTRWLPELEAGKTNYTALAERILQLLHPGGEAYDADTDRARRCGLGEVIFGQGKSAELIETIALRLMAAGSPKCW